MGGETAQKRIDTFFKEPQTGSSSQERTDLRFYLSMLAAARLVGARVRTPQQLVRLADEERVVDEANLKECLSIVRRRWP